MGKAIVPLAYEQIFTVSGHRHVPGKTTHTNECVGHNIAFRLNILPFVTLTGTTLFMYFRLESVLRRLGLFFLGVSFAVLLFLDGAVQALQFDAQRITQHARAQHGETVARRVQDWLAMMNEAQSLPESTRLRVVNDFWNFRVRGGEDIHVWGKKDYWATPLESLAKGAGDCEDFVIAKYFSLVRAGVAPEKLRFIYVRARVGGMGSSASIAHMVLGYYETPDATPLILDNLMGSVVPASRRTDLTPVFSFNAQGVYVAGAATRPVDRIGHWRDLMSRMKNEGFSP